MSIKFPDFQVLVTRADQVPKTQREGDASMAGKLAPDVQQQMVDRQKKVGDTPKSRDARKEKDKDAQGKSRGRKGRRPGGRSLDIRA